MRIVGRAEFMAWHSGALLHFRRGVGIAPNERLCEQVDAAAQRGETVGGRLVSTARLEGDEIVETLVEVTR